MKDLPLSNRDRKLEPRGNSGYCHCDRDYVTAGTKCGVCSRRQGRKRLKKTPAP